MSSTTGHVCSMTPCECPSCGHQDSRDAFEGWEETRRDAAHGRTEWVVRCPECEHLLEDQTNWDDHDCVACEQEGRYA